MTAATTLSTAAAQPRLRRPVTIAAPISSTITTSCAQASPPKKAEASGEIPLVSATAEATVPNLASPTWSAQCIRVWEAITVSAPAASGQTPGRVRNGTTFGQKVIARNTSTPSARNTSTRGVKRPFLMTNRSCRSCLPAAPTSAAAPARRPGRQQPAEQVDGRLRPAAGSCRTPQTLAEDAGRPEHQHQHQHHECHDVSPFRIDVDHAGPGSRRYPAAGRRSWRRGCCRCRPAPPPRRP